MSEDVDSPAYIHPGTCMFDCQALTHMIAAHAHLSKCVSYIIPIKNFDNTNQQMTVRVRSNMQSHNDTGYIFVFLIVLVTTIALIKNTPYI